MLAALVIYAAFAAAEGSPSTIDLTRAAAIFAEADAVARADAGALWGRSLAGPILFVDTQSRSVVANQPDADGRLEEQLLADGSRVFTTRLPDDVSPANTAIRWSGVHWTMLMWPLPEERYARARLLAHELFHRIQEDLGLPAASPPNSHLDGRDGRTWLRLELRALDEALIRSGDARRQAIEDALCFRARRAALCGAQAAAEERALELNEGLAEYTGWRLCGLPAHLLADRAAVAIEMRSPSAPFSRNFAYVTGPAYGLLLDDADPQWRSRLDKEADLPALLRRAVGVGEVAADEGTALARADRYDGRRIIAAEIERQQARDARLAAARARFIDGLVLAIELSENVNYSFNPNNLEAYDDSSTIYGTIRLVDAWGVLEVTSGGALMIRRDGKMTEARVPAPADPTAPLRGDGWVLQLNEGWNVAQDTAGKWHLRSKSR